MTSWDGYLALGSVELVNEERFRTYIENVWPGGPMRKREIEPVAGLFAALGDTPYSTPVEDGAPWVDYDNPITHGFIGARIVSVDGLDDSTESADVVQALNKGGSVGRVRAATREIRISMLLAGVSPEAVQVGYSWLRKSLRGKPFVRSLVPQMLSETDLRFFIQQPDPIDQIVNRIANPTGSGLGESIEGVAGTAYAFRFPNSGVDDWAYRITARTALDAEAQLLPTERAQAIPGQQWVARAQLWRDSTVLGNRTIKLLLRFRDQFGRVIRTVGADDTTVPDGVLYRWTGARWDSTSQMLTPDGMLTNFAINPSSEGRIVGLRPYAGGKEVVRLGVDGQLASGKKAHSVQPGADLADAAVSSSTLAPAEPGQQWWARARGRIITAYGSHHFRADISFLNRARKEIARVQGTKVDRNVSGTYTRWLGQAGRSTSIQYTGDTRRVNYFRNPRFAVDTGTTSGRNATIAREKSSVLGTTYVLRVKPNDTRDVVTGLTLGLYAPKGSTVWVTFDAVAVGASVACILRGEGWELANGASADVAITPTAKTFSIPIKVTSNDPILRIARTNNANMGSWRISKIGILTGNGNFFDGSTANTGPRMNATAFDISAGAVAPDDAAYARIVLTSVNQGTVETTDIYNYDQIALIQQDAPAGDDPAPTLPAYFDGEYRSTYEVIPAYVITSTPGSGNADPAVYDAVVTAAAPVGAVTAELAVQRVGTGGPTGVSGDIVYADNLMLADYDGEDIPDFTAVNRRALVADTERRLMDVRCTIAPAIISEHLYGAGGCNGADMLVDFTLVAENPDHLQDHDDRVDLPLPASVNQGTNGLGAFAKLTDLSIIKNYMPQFAPDSGVIPPTWVTTATAGSVEATGIRNSSTSPYFLQVRSGPSGTIFNTVISAIRALGDDGGYSNAIASIWLGASGTAGKTFTVKLTTYNGQTSVNAYTKTFTTPDTSSDIFNAAHRLDIPLGDIEGAADGFRFTITGPTGTGLYYIGNPQVTLTAAAQPMIYGGLPDDGTYTYDFDGIGYSTRKPVQEIETHTIFRNQTAPPVSTASLGAYDEVGLTTYRTFAAIGSDIVPRNATAVPVARIDFERFISRWVRFRFYRNPLGLSPEAIPPATFEHEWVVDQFRGNVANLNGFMSIVIDGVSERVWLRAWDGTVIPGDQYVGTSDGTPIDWPQLTGEQWVVSVDYPAYRQTTAAPAGEAWWRASMALMIKE